MLRKLIILLSLVLPLAAQFVEDPNRKLPAGYSINNPDPALQLPLTTLDPPTCKIGQSYWNVTTVTFRACSAANTWVNVGGSAFAALTNAANTFTSGLQDFSNNAVDLRLPNHASDPATCSIGQIEVNTGTSLLKFCSATNTWSQAGGAPGGSANTLQFNNGTALGGLSGWTTPDGTVTITGGASAVFNVSAASGANMQFPLGVLFGGFSFTPSGNFTTTGAFNLTFGVPSSSTWNLPIGGGTITTGTGTTGFIPKWNNASGAVQANSLYDDGITTPNQGTYSGTAGFAIPNGGIFSGSSHPTCAVGTASMLCLKGGTAGTPEASVLDLYLNSSQQASINENNTAAMTLTKGLTVNVTPVTVATSTTSDQNLMAFTVPANTLNVVGRTLKVFLAGVYSNVVTAQPTVTLKIKLCSVSGCGSGNVLTAISIASTATSATAVTNLAANLTGYVTVQTAGATSAYEAHGALTIDLGTTNLVADSIFADTNTATISSQTIDTTAQNFLQVAVAFSGASTSNSFTARQLVIEVVN